MTDLVVLILVVVWAAVLAPRVVRHFRHGSSHSSIESFHEQLHLLERTGPKLVQPAYRLETPDAPPSDRGLVLVGTPAQAATPELVRGVRRQTAAWERSRVRRRRRDLLFGLLGLVVVTGGLGAMHDLHLLWALTGVSALALAGYVALVAYAQMLHAERDAARPVVARERRAPEVPWPLHPKHASAATLPGVEVVSPGSPVLARAGYPGAWDDDVLVACVPQHAASGG